MPSAKETAFVDEVLRKSKEQRIPWQATANPSSFVAAIGGKYSAHIVRWENADRTGYNFTFRVADLDGNSLMSVVDHAGDMPELSEMFALAVRKAMQTDERLDEAFEEMKKL